MAVRVVFETTTLRAPRHPVQCIYTSSKNALKISFLPTNLAVRIRSSSSPIGVADSSRAAWKKATRSTVQVTSVPNRQYGMKLCTISLVCSRGGSNEFCYFVFPRPRSSQPLRILTIFMQSGWLAAPLLRYLLLYFMESFGHIGWHGEYLMRVEF